MILRELKHRIATLGRADQTALSLHHTHTEGHRFRVTSVFDSSGEEISVKASTMTLGKDTLTKEDLSRALVYSINQFVEDGPASLSVASLSEQYEQVLDETLGKVNAFRRTIRSDGLVLVYLPIVCLRSWQVHHYEALSRMRQRERLCLPPPASSASNSRLTQKQSPWPNALVCAPLPHHG